MIIIVVFEILQPILPNLPTFTPTRNKFAKRITVLHMLVRATSNTNRDH